MNNLKIMLKNKKVVIGVIVTLLIAGSVGGYFIYDNNRKNEILEKMAITFTDVKEIEYGTKDFDVKKELVKEIKDCELIGDVPKLDTSKIGETKLVFTLSKSDVTKEVKHSVMIVDTKAPEISLEADSKELTIGDEYDIKTNITSVTDVVDGDIALDDKASGVNKKATEEYSKLKKEEITDEIKVADHKLNEFFIETTKNEESGEETTQLFLKNCYYIDGSIDVATADEYKISVVAVDKNGIKSTKEFVVNVKEKPKEEKAPVVNNGGGSGSSSSGGGYTSNSSGGGSSSSGGGATVQRGSKQDIINTALAQVGKAYARDTQGPNSFDCSGLIWYAYTQNGWSIPRNTISGGTRLGSYDDLQPGDIIYMPSQAHVMLFIGNGSVIEAKNENTGVISHYVINIQPDWQFIRY